MCLRRYSAPFCTLVIHLPGSSPTPSQGPPPHPPRVLPGSSPRPSPGPPPGPAPDLPGSSPRPSPGPPRVLPQALPRTSQGPPPGPPPDLPGSSPRPSPVVTLPRLHGARALLKQEKPGINHRVDRRDKTLVKLFLIQDPKN